MPAVALPAFCRFTYAAISSSPTISSSVRPRWAELVDRESWGSGAAELRDGAVEDRDKRVGMAILLATVLIVRLVDDVPALRVAETRRDAAEESDVRGKDLRAADEDLDSGLVATGTFPTCNELVREARTVDDTLSASATTERRWPLVVDEEVASVRDDDEPD